MNTPVRRVAITGLGAITPVGLNVPASWAQVLAGCPGIGPITLFESGPFAVKIAGEAWGFEPLDFMSAREARRADRNVQFALAAAAEAMRAAGLEAGQVEADDFGVMIGSGAAGIHTYTAQQKVMDRHGPGRISPLLIPMITVDSASVQVAIRYGARGPNVGLASACSTGLDAIGAAAEVIRRGDAEVMLAGGTEAAVTPLGIAGFDQMGALSRRNHDPRGASRPFDTDRDGFVLAEGAGLVVLESGDHAQRRGARIWAEVLAYASTTDAVHLTNPDLSGAGPARALSRALTRAGRGPAEVDLVSAHATGTPRGDPAEAAALKRVFADRGASPPVTATKSVTGHLLGAAGAVATIWTVLSLATGLIPPTANLISPDPRCALDHVRGQPRRAEVRTALVTAFGFGGHNSVLVLGE